ncbi:MAG TPA: hypothetical protein DCL15_02800 [Chloroflexi bacterium]|nr:hypothetical protein [Chloroflexota bacterium]HHW85865.1 hypothetical protein [Chloroflexota bacterium]
MLEWEYQLERQKELRREVEQARLAREVERASAQRGVATASIALAIGRALVRMGAWLETLGKPVSECAEEVG